MDFYNKTGKMALGSRLRRLSEIITDQSGKVYASYNVDMQPKWFPIFFALSEGEKSITQIAVEIGHSHPSVSTIVKEMMKKGLVRDSGNTTDGRKNFVTLSEEGLVINERIQDQYADVKAAIETALNETQYNIWKAIEEWEFLLEQKDLVQRVKDEKNLREIANVKILNYKPEYKEVFKSLNEEWISQHFKMEKADYEALDNPEEHILFKGGHIFIALYKGEAVGVCALLKKNDSVYELAKMAVSPTAKGKGIGLLLGLAIISKAQKLGGMKLYLESNTILKPAISLYHKLGFKKTAGVPSPYERCNIQMELNLLSTTSMYPSIPM